MLRNFIVDTRGSVAMMTGLMLTVTAVAAGSAVDYSYATNKRHAMQDAADSAVLAAASMTGVTEDERLARTVEMFMGSKFCQIQRCPAPVVQMDGEAITFEGSAFVATSLLQIAGMSEVEVGVTSRAVPFTERPLDVVMVLDYSGSMNGGNKVQDMAAAATQFINSMEAQPGDTMSVGVVPFSKYVLTPMHGRYLYDVSVGNNLSGQTVVGCILNREHPYSTNADEPVIGTQGSLWPVFSYAAGGSGTYSDIYAGPPDASYTVNYTYQVNGVDYSYRLSTYDNDPNGPAMSVTAYYLDDGAGNVTGVGFDGHDRFNINVSMISGHPTEIRNQGLVQTNDPYANYGGYGGSGGWSDGDDSGLPAVYDQDVLAENLPGDCGQYASNSLLARPLSQNFAELRTSIAAMQPIGLTNIALGMDVGWHMLTPEEPFVEASSEEGAQKVAILLTDGVQTVTAHGTSGVSIGSANANIAESCAAMKADDIEIFTIAFGINDQYTRDLLKACATSEPHYFEPSAGGDLDAVFDSIFKKVISGRVRLTG